MCGCSDEQKNDKAGRKIKKAFKRFKNPQGNNKLLSKIFKLINKFDCDVIHIQSNQTFKKISSLK